MTQRIAGIAWLKYDGKLLPLRGNFTVSPSEYERAMLAGQDYVHGYSDVPRVPFIEGDVSLMPDLSMREVGSLVNVTVTADLANGRVYTMTEAVCTSALELNARDGLTRVRFEGRWCDEFRGSNMTTVASNSTQTTAGDALGGQGPGVGPG